MSEQANYSGADASGVGLIDRADDSVLPIDMHDFTEAAHRCVLVDKTMFIADVLDCDASIVACCRPEGFGKSMNLSMLRAFLGLIGQNVCPCWGHRRRSMPLFHSFKFRARF